MEIAKDDSGKKTRKPIYMRRVTSAAFQIAIDHTFIGTYVTRFRTNDPPENARCPCGDASRSPQHITHQCYRFTWEQAASGINYESSNNASWLPPKDPLFHIACHLLTRASCRPGYVAPERHNVPLGKECQRAYDGRGEVAAVERQPDAAGCGEGESVEEWCERGGWRVGR